MKKVTTWPPPAGWKEVVIPWTIMLEKKEYNPNNILDWVTKQPGGRYHLHGWRATEGFAFRFENHFDAIAFILRWPI